MPVCFDEGSSSELVVVAEGMEYLYLESWPTKEIHVQYRPPINWRAMSSYNLAHGSGFGGLHVSLSIHYWTLRTLTTYRLQLMEYYDSQIHCCSDRRAHIVFDKRTHLYNSKLCAISLVKPSFCFLPVEATITPLMMQRKWTISPGLLASFT